MSFPNLFGVSETMVMNKCREFCGVYKEHSWFSVLYVFWGKIGLFALVTSCMLIDQIAILSTLGRINVIRQNGNKSTILASTTRCIYTWASRILYAPPVAIV